MLGFIVATAVIAWLLLYQQWMPAAIVTAVGLLVWSLFAFERKGSRLTVKYLETIVKELGLGANNSALACPFPLAILGANGDVLWCSKSMDTISHDVQIVGNNIKNIAPDFNFDAEANGIITGEAVFGAKSYSVHCYVLPGDTQRVFVLYFVENTEVKELREALTGINTVVAHFVIDNYDDVLGGMDEISRTLLAVEIDQILNGLASSCNGIVKKLERDRFIFFCCQSEFRKLEEQRFRVLDMVRTSVHKGLFPPTLSMGACETGHNLSQKHEQARAALDMALGRGGDQVVIKSDTGFKYYGGTSKEVEKQTKVKARVIAYALRELCNNVDAILIMGHKTADADCMGAMLGMLSCCAPINSNCKIVLGQYDDTTGNILSRVKGTGKYDHAFINVIEAREMISVSSLIILVDTHRASYCEYPELLSMTSNICIIDHHRRSADFIDAATLLYHQPFASSASEMVCEITQYMGEKANLMPLAAEALYAGIMVDTKNFTFKTGVRTFEAAAFLRRAGADTVLVRQFFKNDLTSYVKRFAVVKNASIYDGIAISVCEDEQPPESVILAQAADELLGIVGVNASFVLCRRKDCINISGRSLGDVNVQVILEKLGGGGHMTVAGAQLTGTTIYGAKEQLLKAINEYK